MYRTNFFGVLIALFQLMACGTTSDSEGQNSNLECGDGTHTENSFCVPDELPTDLECGPGTHEENSSCVPDELPTDAPVVTVISSPSELEIGETGFLFFFADQDHSWQVALMGPSEVGDTILGEGTSTAGTTVSAAISTSTLGQGSTLYNCR